MTGSASPGGGPRRPPDWALWPHPRNRGRDLPKDDAGRPGDRESGMTATDFGLVGGLVLAQNTQTSPPAAPAAPAPATQGNSSGFQVPGATTGAPGGTVAPGAPTGPTGGGG